MIRFGLVGAGILGKLHARVINEGEEETLVAVADLNNTAAQAAAKQFCCAGYNSVEKMLEHEELDAVVVATPDFAHTDPVCMCLKAGKHVLVEKPLALTMADCERIAASKAPELKLMVNFTNRWAAPYAASKDLIASGRIGKPVMMSAKLNDTLWVSTEMMHWTHLTSPAHFLGTHDIDLFQWMFDSPIVEVYARGAKQVLAARGIDTYDGIQTNVKFANGCIGVFENSWITPNTYPIVADGRKQVYTEKGLINLDMGTDQLTIYREDGASYPSFYLRYDDNGRVAGAFRQAHDHFLTAITNDVEPEPNFAAGVRVTKVLEAISKSLATGQVVQPHCD